MKRFAFLLLAVIVGLSISAAIDLPKPPKGFTWEKLPWVEGAALVPDGWYFNAQHHAGRPSYHITEKPLSEKFFVGVHIRAIFDEPDGPAEAEQYMRRLAEKYAVDIVSEKSDRIINIRCRYEIPATEHAAANRVVVLAITYPQTNATYLAVFESPIKEWSRAWPLGEIILENLILSGYR